MCCHTAVSSQPLTVPVWQPWLQLLNMMLQALLQRTYLSALNTAQTLFVRQKHAFDRAVLKPKVRCHFPKPREVKRINVHGWETRMSSPEGRRVLMRRILKGRHNLSH